MTTTDSNTEFSLAQRDAMSRAFSAGNCASEYERGGLFKAWRKYIREHGAADGAAHRDCTHAAFVIGFFANHCLHEIGSRDRLDFDRAYRSPAGRYVVEVARYADDRSEEYAAEYIAVPS